MINGWLETLSQLIGNNLWISPILALTAGILTSFTPCSLSTVPLVIGYVGGTSGNNTKRAFTLSITFALGTALTFTVLGTAASLLGKLIGTSSSVWYIALGVLMVLMALQTFEIFNFIPSSTFLSKSNKRGYAGALIAGILGGFFSSPCATPVLVVLLAMAAKSENLLIGIGLLLMYSIGHGILVVIAGTSLVFVRKLTQSSKYGILSSSLKFIMGIIILILGFYMFYLGF
ncbi:MAG: cytochrome c biogenesis protein CcdA [Bacillota bacterium]